MRKQLWILALALCGCGAGGAEAPEPLGEPTPGGTVVVGLFSECDGFNEFVSTDAVATMIMEHMIYVPLLRWSAEFEIEGAFAKSWEFSEDRKTITMQLRDDLYWHDGVQTTAADVAFSFERFQDPALAYSDTGSFRYLDSVEVLGPFEVQFVFSTTYADQLAHLRKIISPKHLLEGIPSEEMESADFNRHPIGNGPFRFVRWKQAQEIVFEANPDFADGRPFLDRVVFRIVPDQTVIETAFLSGEIDILERVRYEQVGPMRDSPKTNIHSYQQRGYQYIGWNTLNPRFAEPEARRALTMAINRERIVDALVFGEGKVTAHPVMSRIPIYDESIAPHPYDPEKAAQMFADLGWADTDGDGVLDRDGLVFEFDLVTNLGNQLREDTLVMIQDDLQKIGIAVNPGVREWNVFLDEIKAKDFDSCHLAWQTDFIFDPYDIFHSEAIDGKYNMTSYSNPRVDELMSAAVLSPTSADALPLWHEMLGILHEDQPYTILFELMYSVASKPRVQDVHLDVRSFLINVDEWWVAPADRKYAS